MDTREQQFIKQFAEVATPPVAKALRIKETMVPWLRSYAPSTIQKLTGQYVPIFVLELDPSRISAGRLARDQHVLHDISTVYGGANVYWKNSVGVGLVFDTRPKPKVDVLNAVTSDRTALVVGRGRSGKTTLLQHVIASGKYEKVFVFDPKPVTSSEGNKWPGASMVYGRGENYPEIEQGLNEIVAIMGKGGFGRRVLVIVDEFWITNSFIDVSKQVFRLITLGGEPLIDVVVGTHSERVKGLGIDGQGDLREGFESVVRLSKSCTEYQATIAFSGEAGQHEGVLPGPFNPPVKTLTQTATTLPKLDEFQSTTGAWAISIKDQRILVRWGLQANNGELSIGGAAKTMSNYRQTSHLKHHMLKELFAYWETLGLLDPPTSNTSGRVITKQLINLIK